MSNRILALNGPAVLGNEPAAHQLPYAGLRFPFSSETQCIGTPLTINQHFNLKGFIHDQTKLAGLLRNV